MGQIRVKDFWKITSSKKFAKKRWQEFQNNWNPFFAKVPTYLLFRFCPTLLDPLSYKKSDIIYGRSLTKNAIYSLLNSSFFFPYCSLWSLPYRSWSLYCSIVWFMHGFLSSMSWCQQEWKRSQSGQTFQLFSDSKLWRKKREENIAGCTGMLGVFQP